MATVVTTASERRKRSKLKRIVVSEHNYLALKKLGQAGDSFNDVISKLIRIHRIHQEKQQQLQQEQQEREDKNNHAITGGLAFPEIFSELFDEQDRQRLDELLGYKRKSNRDNLTNKQENNNPKYGV